MKSQMETLELTITITIIKSQWMDSTQKQLNEGKITFSTNDCARIGYLRAKKENKQKPEVSHLLQK